MMLLEMESSFFEVFWVFYISLDGGVIARRVREMRFCVFTAILFCFFEFCGVVVAVDDDDDGGGTRNDFSTSRKMERERVCR